ncbi:MAG: hypothetical protein IPM29_13455 [Planctomycetes bacterium]|nr:hypothetical protein [Planctomycetota bacterium]
MSPQPCRVALAVLAAAAACATGDVAIHGGGVLGRGGSFELGRADGFVWGFTADGADLVLRYGSATLRLRDVVPADGLAWGTADGGSRTLDEPDLLFHLASGLELAWQCATVRVGGATYRLLPGVDQSVDRPAR